MHEFQAALRSHSVTHGTPVQGVPAVGSTAILNQQPETRWRRSGAAFDETMATPAPISLRPGSVPPSRVSTVVEPSAGPRQTTTFRTAAGEMADTVLSSNSKRRTVIAVGSIVGLAAVGLAITLLVTRPSPRPAGSAEPAAAAPAPEPAVPEAEPERVPAFEPPPPPPPAVAPTPPTNEVFDRQRKGSARKPKKGGAQVADKPERPDRPTPPAAPPPAADDKNTERW
jgi:hypothetical protein